MPLFLIFYASLFPIFVNAFDSIRRVDPALLNAARMLGASPRIQGLNGVLPAAFPSILAGARLSLGVGWVAKDAGELVGADAGLGFRIMRFQEYFSMDGVMATIVVIGVLGYLADAALRPVERQLSVAPPNVEQCQNAIAHVQSAFVARCTSARIPPSFHSHRHLT